MRTRNKLFSIMMVALIPLVLTACSSKKDLGDSDGMTIGQPEDITYGSGTGVGSDIDGYGVASSVGGVESSAVPGTQADLMAQAGEIVHFGTDRYDLDSQARTILEAQARWLNTYPNLNMTLEGHADERGTREYNLALGERRASSAKNYLIAMGIDPRRINVISYGKEQPIVIGADGQSWAQNRRARTRVE